MSEWKKKFPTEVGVYWFYGYRYGRMSCGTPSEPEYCLVKVRKIANGTLVSTDGQFMSESEVEEAWFKKTKHPDPPKGFVK